jgi:hypothetical protein
LTKIKTLDFIVESDHFMRRPSMPKLMRGAIAVVIFSLFGMTALANSASAGWSGAHGFHAFHGLRGFYGLYPYTLFGYPNYHFGGYYPYSFYYQDNEPNCDFVWANRTTKRKGKGVWKCS